MTTATFNDTYFGTVAMQLKATRTTRGGQRITIYRWTQAPDVHGCITTGMPAYGSEARAIAAAQRHALFSEVNAG